MLLPGCGTEENLDLLRTPQSKCLCSNLDFSTTPDLHLDLLQEKLREQMPT